MQTIEQILKGIKRSGRRIELQLWPAIGQSTIQPEGNRLIINEGRDGKFDEISESYYDELVRRYDSRKF